MSEARKQLEVGWAEVASTLFAAKGINSGLWRIGVKLRFAALTTQWTPQPGISPDDLPTGLVGVESLVLIPVEATGPMVFDAAAVRAGGMRPKKASTKKLSLSAARAQRGKPKA